MQRTKRASLRTPQNQNKYNTDLAAKIAAEPMRYKVAFVAMWCVLGWNMGVAF